LQLDSLNNFLKVFTFLSIFYAILDSNDIKKIGRNKIELQLQKVINNNN